MFKVTLNPKDKSGDVFLKSMYNEKVGATEHPLWEVSDVGDILMRKP